MDKYDNTSLMIKTTTFFLTVLVALSVGILAVGASTAFADDETTTNSASIESYWSAPTDSINIGLGSDKTLLTTYGVRAGSAGPDFLGITNTNFDFSGGSASSNDQYTGYTADALNDTTAGAGLAIWATSVNEDVNPYYANLYYNVVYNGSATQATTWMSNPENSSWGDSNNSASVNVATGSTTIAGLEYSPEIIFGANKYTCWDNALSDGSNSDTNINTYVSNDQSYNPTFASNDATNIWTQVYTMGELAQVADGITEQDSNLNTRYEESAETSAINYEKAIRGNMLYIASKIDSGEQDMKTVAYLYAIDKDGTAYFFTPDATEMTYGDDTGVQGPEEGQPLNGEHKESTVENADGNYAANNGTINLGYMGVLPFITNTFNSGNSFAGGIVMKVEDIYKINPACTVSSTDTSKPLADVDVIIYNSTINTNLDGTSNGKNSSGVNNDYFTAEADGSILTDERVANWADALGFKGAVVAGDDFGTSTQQGYGTKSTTENAMSPLLYCQRNYTADKNARAAWAFSQVYPELYNNNADASYSYWVDKIYHVHTQNVGTIVAYMTNKSDSVEYNTATLESMESNFKEGLQWWVGTGRNEKKWNQFDYYNGSSRASYYSDLNASEELKDTIGIFEPSLLWSESVVPEPTVITTDMFDVDTTYGIYDGSTPVTKSITSDLTEGIDYTVTYTNNNKAGEATITITGIGDYEGTLTYTFKIIHYFEDVWPYSEGNNWYFDAVYGMVDLGAITGYNESTFGVGDAMSRAQLVTIMWRYCEPEEYANYDEPNAKDTTGLPDAQNGMYYTGAVNWAYANGVITGNLQPDGTYTLNPDDPVTFDQMVTILARYVLGFDGAADYNTSFLNNGNFTDKDAVEDFARGAMSWAIENEVVTGNNNGDGTFTLDPTSDVARERATTVLYRSIDEGLLVISDYKQDRRAENYYVR